MTFGTPSDSDREQLKVLASVLVFDAKDFEAHGRNPMDVPFLALESSAS
jgi:hypothetical protein